MNRLADPLLQRAGALAWSQRNQQWLSQRLAHWRDRLAQRAPESSAAPDDMPPAEQHDGFEPAALRLAHVLNLTPFETELLVLAAGIEIDNALRQAVAAAQGLPASQPVQLGYSLALALLPQAHWDALSPARPLRHWALVHVDASAGLAQARLRIDERVLHHLTGVAACDERLAGIVEVGDAGEAEPPPLQTLATRIAAAIEGLPEPLVMLGGGAGEPDGAARSRAARVLAGAVLRRAGLGCLWIDPAALGHDPREIVETARRIDLEAALAGAGVSMRLGSDSGQGAAALRLIGAMRSPVIGIGSFTAAQLAELPRRRPLRFGVPVPPTSPLDEWPAPVRAAAARALQQFRVDPALLEQALAELPPSEGEALDTAVWDALRDAARGGLDTLAQRITSRTGFDDMVLPPLVAAQLREIGSQLRHRLTVYEDWGFAAGQARGLGIAALFAGESGTGKTMAAEAIANEARLDLYRIDLASLVSKYIGETEKNLAKLFDAAEASGAVLLFDEADALFGKRSEVKDSHDRYANIEVAYLLQRIESYRGLAILTTNLKSSLDRAFLRRIRFVVQFPFPDEAAREQIWRRQIPARAPISEIDFPTLAKLPLAGGHIRGIVLNAAFRAAGRGSAIGHDAMVESARAEFSKLERPFPDGQRGGVR